MTDIKDLEMRIEGAEDALTFVKDQLAGLKTHLQELKEQEEDKQPESLFGRWATHPEYGRGIIASRKPDGDGEVRFAYRTSRYTDEVNIRFVLPEHLTLDFDPATLTLDPATLTTTEDFEDAPEGTIVEAPMYPKDVAVKTEDGWYRTGGMHAIAVEYMPTCRVIRWGNGQ